MVSAGLARLVVVPGLARQYSNSVPILLLPPSEGKAEGGTSRIWTPDSGTFSTLEDLRHQVVEALAAAEGGSEKLLGLTGERLERARSCNAHLFGARSLPAWRRYTGVVWEHLDPGNLPAADRRRIVVPSGLLGLARGDDRVPEYRLKMGASLAPMGKLSTWWRPELSAALNRYARGRSSAKSRFIVDMLPQEHRAAWRPDDRIEGVSVDFVDPSGRPGGHFAKAAKGTLARAILTAGLTALDGWTTDRFELVVRPIA